MDIKKFQDLNDHRSKKWHRGIEWDLSKWALALAGESGEACNVVKKINRVRDGIQIKNETEDELMEMLGYELADVVMQACLLASSAGIDLQQCCIEKFNAKSAELDLPVYITPKGVRYE